MLSMRKPSWDKSLAQCVRIANNNDDVWLLPWAPNVSYRRNPFLARAATQPRSFEPTHLLRPSLCFRERDLGALFRVREAALTLYHAVAHFVVFGFDFLLEQGWVEVVGFGGGGGGGGGVGSFDDSVGVDGSEWGCCGWWRRIGGGWWRAGLYVEL